MACQNLSHPVRSKHRVNQTSMTAVFYSPSYITGLVTVINDKKLSLNNQKISRK